MADYSDKQKGAMAPPGPTRPARENGLVDAAAMRVDGAYRFFEGKTLEPPEKKIGSPKSKFLFRGLTTVWIFTSGFSTYKAAVS